jgi:hypothetical protein
MLDRLPDHVSCSRSTWEGEYEIRLSFDEHLLVAHRPGCSAMEGPPRRERF